MDKKNIVQPQYFEAVGRRKTAIARVRIFRASTNEPDITVNNKDYTKYFPLTRQHKTVLSPLEIFGVGDKTKTTVLISGGGLSAQAEAVRHGISRALVKMDNTLKKKLRRAGYITRDSRMVERKKYGLKKARRAPQWKKR